MLVFGEIESEIHVLFHCLGYCNVRAPLFSKVTNLFFSIFKNWNDEVKVNFILLMLQ